MVVQQLYNLNGNYLNPFAVVFAVCDSVLSEEGEALASSP